MLHTPRGQRELVTIKWELTLCGAVLFLYFLFTKYKIHFCIFCIQNTKYVFVFVYTHLGHNGVVTIKWELTLCKASYFVKRHPMPRVLDLTEMIIISEQQFTSSYIIQILNSLWTGHSCVTFLVQWLPQATDLKAPWSSYLELLWQALLSGVIQCCPFVHNFNYTLDKTDNCMFVLLSDSEPTLLNWALWE